MRPTGESVDYENGAAEQTQWLIGQDVSAIVGPITSAAAVPASEVAQAGTTVLISPTATGPNVTDGKSYVFRAALVDPMETKAMARFALTDPSLDNGASVRSAAIIFDQSYPPSALFAQGFKEAFEAEGGHVVKYPYTIPPGGTISDVDFSLTFQAIKDSGAQVVYLPVYADSASVIAGKARLAGVQSVFLGSSFWDSPELDTQALDGSYLFVYFDPSEPRPVVQNWVEAYRAKNGGATPDAFAALTYDATRLVARAVEQAGSSDPARIREALAQTRDYEGPSGKIQSFDSNGNPIKSALVMEISDGTRQYYSTVYP